MRKRLIFRAEANESIGRGHISRCIAIADMVKDNFEILFICLQINKNFVEIIMNDYSLVTIKNDNELLEIITKKDFLWIDGYHFTETWKKGIRPMVKKLIETNDIPYVAKNIDIIVNHTPGLTKESFKGSSSDIQLYLGLDYALIRQKFLQRAKENKVKSFGSGVFICFGGVDNYNLGEKFVLSLLENNFSHSIYWVTNASNQIIEKKEFKNVKILSNLDENKMIEYMTRAKVVLIPSSVLCFEAMALRKPIFTCYYVDNQKLIHRGLVENMLATGLGYLETKNDVLQTVKNLLDFYDNNSLQLKQIDKQKQLLDGQSSERIKEIILK